MLKPGRAVRTVFDGVQVVLWRDAPDAFRLDVWRSFMPHVRALLETGRRELATGL
jgi:sarcosine oxidase subunit gamma